MRSKGGDRMEDVKCQAQGCVGSANESGYCEQHDPYRVKVPTNGIGITLYVIGALSILIGVITIFTSFLTAGLPLVVSGIAFLGFGEVVNLLQKISHVKYVQYQHDRMRADRQ